MGDGTANAPVSESKKLEEALVTSENSIEARFDVLASLEQKGAPIVNKCGPKEE